MTENNLMLMFLAALVACVIGLGIYIDYYDNRPHKKKINRDNIEW